ncbi:MAG: Xaa-Pro peptidase family protein [Verrucomicrobiales bacterium]|jgi:Xaa-Pro aminopeptidase|nr:Xaa-Pro peptidase family protein [Verrucomicrobiales bacterium]
MSRPAAKLIIANSEQNADLLYATKFFAPDEFIWLAHRGKTAAVFSPLEIDRARQSATVDECIPLTMFEDEYQKRHGHKPDLPAVAALLLRREKIRRVNVPAAFPLACAQTLQRAGITVNVATPFLPQREFKTAEEIKHITAAQRHAEFGLARGLEILRAATVDRKNFIVWNGKKLTSEILRGEIDAAIIRHGGLPANTIVAGGAQGCDPHEQGHGPLLARRTIVLDLFPRDRRTGYFGDLTRSVVKGAAGDALKQLYATVSAAQNLVLRALRPGVDGAKLHERVKQYFTAAGYPTEQRDGHWVGFFHGTGHSLGLEIHEAPRFSAGKFKAGQIMTVEPGLYYPDIGAIRIEDLVILTATGHRNLTNAPKFLEID